MHFGESIHALDSKHRVVIPKRLHETLARDEQGEISVVLTRGFERCLFVFSDRDFKRVLERMKLQPFGGEELRRMQRLFFANVQTCQLDGSGRILLPERLREYAGIQPQGEVAVLGIADRAEIWDRATWQRFQREHDGEFDSLDQVLCGEGGGMGPV